MLFFRLYFDFLDFISIFDVTFRFFSLYYLGFISIFHVLLLFLMLYFDLLDFISIFFRLHFFYLFYFFF